MPTSWAGWGGDATGDRAKVEWVVRAPANTAVDVAVRHARAGAARTRIALT
jgi:hypothetical protein